MKRNNFLPSFVKLSTLFVFFASSVVVYAIDNPQEATSVWSGVAEF
jgi:hypothetical protein